MKNVFLLGNFAQKEDASQILKYIAAENFLKQKGFIVVNPVALSQKGNYSRRNFLIDLIRCDSVLLIDDSEYCKIELLIAKELDITIIHTLNI